MIKYFGCHVSCSGGLENALKNGKTLGVNAIQLHPSAPQRWVHKPFNAGIEESFLAERENSGILRIFFHGIYLINLANPDKQKFHLSKLSLVHYLELAQRLGVDGVIFHLGSNVHQPSEEEGFAQAASGINWILEHATGSVKLLLEVAAGSGKIIGDRLEELALIYEQVQEKTRVGFALDTQHMWASGYDFTNELESIVQQVESILGLAKIGAIHLNDSKTQLGSKKDRHENLGQGLIGEATIRNILNHPKLAQIPFILETPDLESIEGAKKEISQLKKFAGL